MKEFILKPVDWFYFKNQSTTRAGFENENVLTSIFPPRPNTVYGALRSAYIHKYSTFQEFYEGSNEQVKQWMGTKNEKGQFTIKGVFIKEDREFLLPLPLNYQFIQDRKNEKTIHQLELKKSSTLSSSSNTYALFLNIDHEQKVSNPEGHFISATDWKKIILGKGLPQRTYTMSDLILSERKTGIMIDHTTDQAKKGYLYHKDYLYLQEGVSLSVIANQSPSMSEIPFVQLGGAQRPWSLSENEISNYNFWTDAERNFIKENIKKTNIAKIHVLTPAIWHGGAKPNHCDAEGNWRLTNEITVRWLTGAIGRPEIYGGWDIAHGRPKLRKYMIPAGSVIYIRVPDDLDIDPLLAGFSISDEAVEEGFGFSMISC